MFQKHVQLDQVDSSLADEDSHDYDRVKNVEEGPSELPDDVPDDDFKTATDRSMPTATPLSTKQVYGRHTTEHDYQRGMNTTWGTESFVSISERAYTSVYDTLRSSVQVVQESVNVMRSSQSKVAF